MAITMEELRRKAKAYDVALERAKEIVNNQNASSIWKDWLRNTFPELKNEDERVRKELIELIGCMHDADPRKKGWLAWLEKQSSNNIKWNKNTKDNKPQVNHSVLMQTIYGIAEGEWRGEDWCQYRWSGIIKDNEVIAWIELSDIEKHSKKSKVEEKAEAFTAAHQGEKLKKLGQQEVTKISDQVKDSDWSEEDEHTLQGVIDEIQANKSQAPDYDFETYDRFLSWLKAIKQRVGWKPSDEQMKALALALHDVHGMSYKKHLFSLKQQLKQLWVKNGTA